MTRFILALAGGALATLGALTGVVLSIIAVANISPWFIPVVVVSGLLAIVAGLFTFGGLGILALALDRP